MLQPKKRTPKDMAPRAYELFRRAEKTGRVLTVDMIAQYSGYSTRTVRGYISKKYRYHFLHPDGTGGYTVNGIGQISRAEFISWHRQTVKSLRSPMPPAIIEPVVVCYYRIEPNSVEMWLVIIVLLTASRLWHRL